MKASYNWLQEYIEGELPKPKELGDLITKHAYELEGIEELNGDYILDFDVQPNRAHDSFCNYGIAREVTVLTGSKLKEYKLNENKSDFKSDVKVEINDDRCNRYISRKIKNIKVGESSPEIKHKLEAMDQRSINNIVDLTNIVLFEIGQPTHAFDANKVEGDTIYVRPAKEGEKLTTLDDKEVEFKKGEMLIADERALSIAGIKGGKDTGVDEGTTDILLEAASFNHAAVRFARRDIGIQTDSSKRFEREISANLPEVAMQRLTDLILEHASTDKTEISDMVDVYPNPVEDVKVSISLGKINKHLGTTLGVQEVEDIWKRLYFTSELDGENLIVTIPDERLDLRIEEDLVEEVARIYGYDNIESREVVRGDTDRVLNKEYFYLNKISNFLLNKAFSEVMTYVLRDKGTVELANPLASDKKYMRDSLVPGMQDSLKLNLHNIDLLGLEEIKTFETGKIFDEGGEYWAISVGWSNPNMKVSKNEENVKQLSKELGEFLDTEIKPDIVDGSIFEINISKMLDKLSEPEGNYELDLEESSVIYKPFSQYPFVLRDIAVWVPEDVSKEDLLEVIKENAGDLLVKDRLFDEFSKDGRTSYAYRLVFQSYEKTLTDEEVGDIMKGIESKVAEKGWEVR